MANREEAQKRIDAVVRDLRMTDDQRQEFHRYLHKYYSSEKDEFDYNRLRQVAEEFLRNNS
jgi:hypothetical protein